MSTLRSITTNESIASECAFRCVSAGAFAAAWGVFLIRRLVRRYGLCQLKSEERRTQYRPLRSRPSQ